MGKFWLHWSYSSLTHYEELNSPMCILCRALGRQSQKTPTPSSSICFRNAGIEIQLKGLTSLRYWKFFRDSPKRSALCIFGSHHQFITCLHIVIMIFCNSKSWSLLNLALLLFPVECYAILNLQPWFSVSPHFGTGGNWHWGSPQNEDRLSFSTEEKSLKSTEYSNVGAWCIVQLQHNILLEEHAL